MADGKMRLGLSMRGIGYHSAAWRHPDVPASGAMRFDHFVRVAQAAERGLFDMVFLADGIGIRGHDKPEGALARSNLNVELEPLTLLSALAPVTRHIGLVATASTTYNEPYHIARKFASLDHISGGRAGWNIVTSWSDAEAWNFNREKHLEYETRYERAREFVDVVTGLWNSWDEGAFLHDKESGLFYDESKLHTLNHHGQHFSVRGPLSVDRTPQGRPILVQAGASPQGQDIAAAVADVVFAAQQDLEAARAYYRSIKDQLARYGRDPDSLLIMPGFVAIVGETEREAREKLEALQDLIDPITGLAHLYGQMGDLSAYPIDGPVPDPADPGIRSRAHLVVELARRNNWTIRDLYTATAAGRGHRMVVGTPAQIVDAMQEWTEAGAADGWNIIPAQLPGSIDDFVELVVPEMQRRGIFRTAYEGDTLRANLGLRVPGQTLRAVAE
ncbi:LLM class flavin-dependent oxidoreductase [Roseomonas gilardii]|uniref:LLM class flavin-dependent oxidoreductase n=1 Tax=Roseomonas gilardii TaxID=257708 RepID=UPI0011A1A46F|nr:LLM class flavin-dependent oxidoreductase [Roseomonas gilardii]